jgi:purine nucleosidase/pyrimidine-specific ribonucleoside hydrolase
MPGDPVPIILDTDIGDDIDDMYALYLALFHPGLDLRAVTTVHSSSLRKARFVGKALRVAGLTDLPIGWGIDLSVGRAVIGQNQPDTGDLGTHLQWVGEGDPEMTAQYPRAVEVILDQLDRTEEPIALVSIGACSNLADAISKATERQRSMVRCIALMSGEPNRQMPEHNVMCDPEAADYVYSCGITVFMGTYDVTRQLVLTMDEAERRLGAEDTPTARALLECTRLWAPHRGHKPGPVLYDLVPLLWLTDDSLVETRPSTIRVELQGRYTRGMTVRTAPEGHVLESTAADGAALTELSMETILKGARQRA